MRAVVWSLWALACLLPMGCTTSTRSAPTARDPHTLSPDERAIWAAQQAEAERVRRAQKSNIPGLTQGELEDMPDAPPLPSFISAQTTPEQLALQAQLTARSEYGNVLPATIRRESRAIYLLWIWRPEMDSRQAGMRSILADRKALSDSFLTRGNQELQWREEADRRRRAFERQQDLQWMGFDVPEKR